MNATTTVLTHGQRITIDGSKAYVLTVDGMWNDEVRTTWTQCPQFAMTLADWRAMDKRNTENAGMKAREVYINVEGLCLHDGPREVEAPRVALSIGDRVEVDGREYTICPDHNHNFKLES